MTTNTVETTALDALLGGIIALGLLAVLAIPFTLYGAVWLNNSHRPGILIRTAENPAILPWYWTASNVGGPGINDASEKLCLVDIHAGFVPMGTMDTGRTTLTPVMAYKPTTSFWWQCPRGTIVEMDAATLQQQHHALQEAQEKAARAKTDHARALAITQE